MATSKEKFCSKCGKQLRSDNTKGYCGVATACARRVAAGARPPSTDDEVLARAVRGEATTPPKTDRRDALKRFRTVAEAFGYDPDGLLATYAEGWLAAVKQSVDKLEAPANE